MRPESSSRMAINRKINNDVKFADMTSLSNFFDVVLFLLSILVTGPSITSILSLFLESQQFSCLEIRKLEIPPSKFCPIYGDWSELGIPNLAQMPLIKSYWMQQNAKVSALIVSELLRENQQEVKLLPTQG